MKWNLDNDTTKNNFEKEMATTCWWLNYKKLLNKMNVKFLIKDKNCEKKTECLLQPLFLFFSLTLQAVENQEEVWSELVALFVFIYSIYVFKSVLRAFST